MDGFRAFYSSDGLHLFRYGMMAVRSFPVCLSLILTVFFLSCTPPPPLDETALAGYRTLKQLRARQFRSAAFLIDLRVNDDGHKFSMTTEVYFSGDSTGFYGRGYFGKGTFKGNIIDDVATIYFENGNEYFRGYVSQLQSGADCSSPGEVLIYALSLLSCREDQASDQLAWQRGKREVAGQSGRFFNTVTLRNKKGNAGYPAREKLIDPGCRDSIVVKYDRYSDDFPYYKPRDILYYNGIYNFRAKGFIREQKYNIAIKTKKFDLVIPADAVRLERL